MTFNRIGIYFTPAPGDFSKAGANWLGWDISSQQFVGKPNLSLVQRPQKYGFHATLKPPFRLASGLHVNDTVQKVGKLSRTLTSVTIERLRCDWLGSFLALQPSGDIGALCTLAERVLRDTDELRAPATETELAKRRNASMTARQLSYIERWGYAHVLEHFRFHMTLTGPVPRAQRDEVLRSARNHFRAAMPAPMVIDGLTLVGERQDGMFCEIERFELRGADEPGERASKRNGSHGAM